MATLTWRNVDAPNFSGALEGYRTASSLLNNAVRGAQDVVGGFQRANSDAADRAILSRTLGIQDPAQYQRALADGTLLGPNGANASLDTLRGLDNRVGTLLDRSTKKQSMEQTAYENQRGRDTNALSDAAAPDIAQARLLARNNDQAGLNQLLQTSPTLRALRPEQLANLVTGVDNLSSNFQSRRGTDASFGQDQWKFGREVRDAADQDAASAALVRVLRTSGNAADAQGNVEAMADQLSPGAFQRLVRGAQGSGYNLYGPVTGTTGAGAAATPNRALGIMTGGAALPDTIRTVGDMVDGKSGLLQANPKGTATGMYQITSDTWKQFAPKALGTDWRNADIRDPQVQDKVGEAIWNSISDSPKGIRNRWASVSEAEAEQLRGAPWDQVRDILSQKESSSTASQILAQQAERLSNNLGAGTAAQLIAERAGQNQAVGLFPELNKLQSDRRDASQVVDGLTGSDGPLRNSNRGQVLDYVNWIVQNSGGRINPAMAGQMLARNIQSADNPIERFGSMVTDIVGAPFGRRVRTANLGDGIRLNDEGVYRMIDEYLQGGTSTRGQAQTSLGATQEMVQSAQEAYNQADAQYRAMLNASQNRPGLIGNLERYKQQRDAAEQALRRVVQSVVNSDTLTPRYDRPVGNSRGQ